MSRARPRAMVGGAQLIHGWWGSVAQCYIEEVGVTARSTRFSTPPHTPATTLATEVALERQQGPPSPSCTSCFITRTCCHRPHLRRFPTATLTEPAPSLTLLRQAEEAPATSTDEMAPTHRQRLPPLLMVCVLLLPLLVLLLVSVYSV
jgi:hypothetical protein